MHSNKPITIQIYKQYWSIICLVLHAITFSLNLCKIKIYSCKQQELQQKETNKTEILNLHWCVIIGPAQQVALRIHFRFFIHAPVLLLMWPLRHMVKLQSASLSVMYESCADLSRPSAAD